MRAIVVEHLGEAGSLRDVPTPRPGAGEMLVRVTAAGVNPIDWKRRARPDSTFPFVAGQDFAGVVSRPAERSGRYREGERVFGVARGSFAEYVVAPENEHAPVAKIPDAVGDADAAALPTAALTALAGLDALRVAKGTTLLVLGATGGVGGFAVQIAKGRGARVIGTASSSNESVARSLGVDAFVAYDRGDVVDAIKAAHPGGVDAVLDLVDDADALKRTATLLRDGGAIVSTIGAVDEKSAAPRNLTAQNLYAADSPQWSHAGLRTLLQLLEEGTLRVTIAGEHPLSEAVEALEQSKRGAVNGKLVITVA
jgi:NADPH:quinone reductase-like Zn-dependent oxidoreductase